MDRLTAVFRDVFDDSHLQIDGLTRENFSAWDSLAHVKLVLGIEDEFGVKFTTDQVVNTRSVDEFLRLLAAASVT